MPTTPKKHPKPTRNTAPVVVGEVMNVRMAADYLLVCPETIYRLASAGAIPHRKIGRNILRFRKSALDQWMEAKPKR